MAWHSIWGFRIAIRANIKVPVLWFGGFGFTVVVKSNIKVLVWFRVSGCCIGGLKNNSDPRPLKP